MHSPRNYDVDAPDYDDLGAFRGIVFVLKNEAAFVALALAARWVMS
jgi:hypothetical protein